MEFIKNNKYCIILSIFTLIFLCLSLGHYTNLYVDIGREMYYPYAISNGDILYKDLFCIYGPFSYLLNALIFKIFGAKLASLYGVGIICAFLTVIFTYKIAEKFLSEKQSFLISFFVSSTGCLATRIFNFTLPYSYAMLFGLVCFLISVYFLINFIEKKKQIYLVMASIFAGIAVSSKYDFVLYLVFFFIIAAKMKYLKTALKYSLFALLFPFIVLFFQGLSFEDLFAAIENIKNFTSSNALKTFYITQGVYYTGKIWMVWLYNFLFTLIPFAFILIGTFFYKKRKILSSISILSGMIIAFCCADDASYLYLTFFVLILFIFRFKKNTYTQNVFILSSILVSLKSLWGLSHSNYGLYFIGIMFISFLILIKKEFIKNAVLFLMLGACFNYIIFDIVSIKACNTKIITDKGFLKTLPEQGAATNALIDFVNNIKEENPYIMVFPEGMNINFLAYKKNYAKGVYSSLIPLYIEGQNEEKIIRYYENNLPLYMILSSSSNKDYGEGTICDTYALKFCKFIYQNYLPFDKIEENEVAFFIFRLK